MIDNNKIFFEDDTEVALLISIFLKNKLTILIITFLVSLAGVVWSLSLPNTYTSSAVLAPANSGSLSAISSQYSGLASIAGISLPSSGETDKVALGLETLKSFYFFEEFVKKHDLLITLVAAEGWNKDLNILIIDEDIYDVKNNKWVSDIEYSVDGKPSYQYSHREFLENLSISKEKLTGFVTISYEHVSPFISRKVIDLIISDINEIERVNDIDQAKRSIKFLEKEIKGSQLAEVRIGLHALIQKQIETVMLANATPEYLFKIASPPISPEIKTGPKRSIICILAFFMGLFLSFSLVLFSHYLKESRLIKQ